MAPQQPSGLVRSSEAREFVPGEVIVRFKEGVPQAARIDALNSRGARFERGLPVRGMQLLRTTGGRSVARTVTALEADPRVAWAEPNYVRRPALAINGPRATELWGLENTGQTVNGTVGLNDKDIDVTTAWDITTGHSSVIVAVLDTGIIPSHPDVAANLWTNPGEIAGNGRDDDANGIVDDIHGADWTGAAPDGDPTDVGAAAVSSHGTHVASTIAARGADNLGIVGVAPDVRIMPLRFLAQDVGSSAGMIAGINYAHSKGARILNGSFGGGGFSQAEVAAMAAASDMLFVFAAGNGGADGVGDNNDSLPEYPCNYDLANIVCVAATNQSDVRASFSNFGATSVDLAAPGVNILGGAAKFEAPLLTDGFENPGGIGGWAPVGIPNSWGLATLGASGSAQSLTDSPGGNYAPAADNSAELALPQDLTGRRGCHLTYDFRLQTQNAGLQRDLFLMESSGDGITWDVHTAWAGSTGTAFVPDVADISARDGENAARMRFALFANGDATVGDGVYVDNVRLACLAAPGSYIGGTDEYAFLSGTSMATPHVAGVAALVLSLDAALTPAQIKARLLDSVDPVLNVPTVTNGRLNADRAVRMAPRAETGLASGTTAGGATLMGIVSPRGQATSVRFEYGLTTSYELGQTPAQQIPAGRTPQQVTAAITGLQPSEIYHYRIVATNATGTTNGLDGTFAAVAADAPTAPTGLTATVQSGTEISLSWTAATDNVAVTGYRVERCEGVSCSNFTEVTQPTGTAYNDTGRTPAATYRYRVRATDAAANLGAYSGIAGATTPDTLGPSAPSGLAATAQSSTEISLSWTAAADNVAVTGYRVERCEGAGCASFAEIAQPTGGTFNDTGRSPATSYSYRVRATDAATNLGPYSGSASAATPALPVQPASSQPTPPAALQSQGTPTPAAAPVTKAGPCTRLTGKKKATCIRRQAALKKCAKLKAGPTKRACIVRAKRLK